MSPRCRPRCPQLIFIHIHQLFRVLYTLLWLDTVNIYWRWCINLCRVRCSPAEVQPVPLPKQQHISNQYIDRHVCTYVRRYVCMYVCMDGWMDGWMYVCMYIYIYIHISLYLSISLSLSIYIYIKSSPLSQSFRTKTLKPSFCLDNVFAGCSKGRGNRFGLDLPLPETYIQQWTHTIIKHIIHNHTHHAHAYLDSLKADQFKHQASKHNNLLNHTYCGIPMPSSNTIW